MGTRGVGSENSCGPIWGLERQDYIDRADPWPLNPDGELMLGLKIESAAAIPHIEETMAVPGISFAEFGPGACQRAAREQAGAGLCLFARVRGPFGPRKSTLFFGRVCFLLAESAITSRSRSWK